MNDLPVRQGRAVNVRTLAGDDVSLAYAIVDASELVVSNFLDGTINPDYPQELQPRDRTSLESKLQVNRIAADLNPESLSDSETSASGAPIVGPDLVVESGNGRVMGIQRAYASEQADDYADWVIARAGDYGLDDDAIAGLDSPVLVRVRTSDVDRAKFASDSNTRTAVPDKEQILEKAMSDTGAATKLEKAQRKNAARLLEGCASVSSIVLLLNALNHKARGEEDNDGYYLGLSVDDAIRTLMNTTPDNDAALGAYQALCKRLIGTKIGEVYDGGMTQQGRVDFREVVGINNLIKQGDWSIWFNKGEVWQTALLLKAYLGASDDDRPDIARQIMPVWSKCVGGRTFNMSFLAAMRKIFAFIGETGSRPAEMYNRVIRDSLRRAAATFSAEDARNEMDASTSAGRSVLDRLHVSEKARQTTENLRKDALELANILKGALSQEQINEALRWTPAIKAMADYDPEKDVIFGARYSPMSSFLRSMERSSTQAILERISKVDPYVADMINNFYVEYKRGAIVIQQAVQGHVDGLIANSAITDEQAEEWLNGIEISKAALKSFDARFGKGAIQQELKKIYRLSNGTLKTLKSINFKARQRAFARMSTGEVMLSDSDDLSVLWHEVGHHFEFSNPDRLEKARQYLRKRMGEQEQYTIIEGTKDERAIRDSLSETYIGRVYGDKTINGTDSTEVFSMAFQCVLDTNYCGNSIMNNDELMDFFLGEIGKVHNA